MIMLMVGWGSSDDGDAERRCYVTPFQCKYTSPLNEVFDNSFEVLMISAMPMQMEKPPIRSPDDAHNEET